MALIRQSFNPSAGLPQPVVLQPKRKMVNSQFYQQMQQQPLILGETNIQTSVDNRGQLQQPTSEEFIRSQLQRYSQKAAVPELEPGARVTSPNSELVQPSNFQSYYNRLAAIKQSNQALLGAAQARSAFQRMQTMQTPIRSIGYKNPSYSPISRVGNGIPSNPAQNFQYAKNIAGNYGWGNEKELSAWYTLGMKESGWKNTAQNPTSTAYGIGQFLDSTWRGYGIPKTSDPALQVEAMARYIRARYGSPSAALAFHYNNNWY